MSLHEKDHQSPRAGFVGRLRSITSGRDHLPSQGTVGGSTIGADFTITGDISCNGEAQLDGEVNGNVECQHLVVGRNGRIKGDVRAEDVVVYGRVNGSIHGTNVALKSGASVEGDIYHRSLAIEVGATFLGRSDRLTGTLVLDTDASAGSDGSTRAALTADDRE